METGFVLRAFELLFVCRYAEKWVRSVKLYRGGLLGERGEKKGLVHAHRIAGSL